MVLWIIESRKVEVSEVVDRAKTYEMRKQDRPFMKIVLGPELLKSSLPYLLVHFRNYPKLTD